MYCLDHETEYFLKKLNEKVFSQLHVFIENPFLTQPNTMDIDTKRYDNYIRLERNATRYVKKYLAEYGDMKYVEIQLNMYLDLLKIIRNNIHLMLYKHNVEIAFNKCVSWENFELLFTEYQYEVCNIENCGKNKVNEIYEIVYGSKPLTTKEFLDNCTACGGNWVAMLLTGIERCFPNDYQKLLNECNTLAENDSCGARRFNILCVYLSEKLIDWESQ